MLKFKSSTFQISLKIGSSFSDNSTVNNTKITRSYRGIINNDTRNLLKEMFHQIKKRKITTLVSYFYQLPLLSLLPKKLIHPRIVNIALYHNTFDTFLFFSTFELKTTFK